MQKLLPFQHDSKLIHPECKTNGVVRVAFILLCVTPIKETTSSVVKSVCHNSFQKLCRKAFAVIFSLPFWDRSGNHRGSYTVCPLSTTFALLRLLANWCVFFLNHAYSLFLFHYCQRSGSSIRFAAFSPLWEHGCRSPTKRIYKMKHRRRELPTKTCLFSRPDLPLTQNYDLRRKTVIQYVHTNTIFG